ncbi:MAG: nucleoside-triphosphatase, partial [Candidatus Aminicenantales bacterium]
KIIYLSSGVEEVLAYLNIKRGPGVARYKVNVAGIDKIMEKFLESFEDSDYVVIDEIGMMEFYSAKFRQAVMMVLESDKTVVATLSKKFVKQYSDQGHIYYLTRDNFEEIYNKVLRQIK